jgi:hypothetical protein
MKYPLYIVSKDDVSIRIFRSSKDLGWMEDSDIEDGLYAGWDSEYYPFRVLWTDKGGVTIEQTSNLPQPDEMRQVFFRYVDACSASNRPDKPFVYEKSSDDYEGIIDALKSHIKNAPSQRRAIKIFGRF